AGSPPITAMAAWTTGSSREEVRFGAKVGPAELSADAQRRMPEAMSFRIFVGGDEAGEATLWWDTCMDVPIERHQIVWFSDDAGGVAEMRVRETYTLELLRRDG